MSRLLVIELNEEGELVISESSDEWSAFELVGISRYLYQIGDSMLMEEEPD